MPIYKKVCIAGKEGRKDRGQEKEKEKYFLRAYFVVSMDRHTLLVLIWPFPSSIHLTSINQCTYTPGTQGTEVNGLVFVFSELT